VRIAIREGSCTKVDPARRHSPEYQVQVGSTRKRAAHRGSRGRPGTMTRRRGAKDRRHPPRARRVGGGLRILALVADEVEVAPAPAEGPLLRFVKGWRWVQIKAAPATSPAQPRSGGRQPGQAHRHVTRTQRPAPVPAARSVPEGDVGRQRAAEYGDGQSSRQTGSPRDGQQRQHQDPRG